ncbi:DUF427 domain-containing protein [Candidatus Dojkabacteria bacterium]|uniref:DUF427 domain-containing protein n=1 Tax=Candidatus Dojkabacteria bacterium TaxID=2099670 RepID=A0A955RLR0_9BACT|nr:DUF427 domain-containing protein [Candidatus Dojkabacteria bacterium]
MAKVIFNNQVIAEAPDSDILMIEGNKYFPPNSIKSEFFKETDLHTICPWKGEASYYSVTVGDKTEENAAWFYKEPKEGSNELVAKNNNKETIDFSNYVAFYKDKVTIS